MIYGDEPLQLHAYTYSPQISSITQAGNLYFYALNNPVAYRDSRGYSATATWMQVAQSLPYWDGPYPYADAAYAIGSGIATLIDWVQSIDVSYYPELLSGQTTSTSRSGDGFTRSSRKGGGFSEEARSKGKGASQSATGGATAPSGGPNKNKKNKKPNIRRLTDYDMRKYGIDAHEVKKDYFTDRAQISHYELYYDLNTGEIFIGERGGRPTDLQPTGWQLWD